MKNLFLNRVGIFTCRKCGMMVESERYPSPNGCLAGSGAHSWTVTWL
jgi:hypothetical protein